LFIAVVAVFLASVSFPGLAHASDERAVNCVVQAAGGLPAQGDYPFELMKRDAQFRRLFRDATRNKGLPEWARSFGGVQGPTSRFSAAECPEIVLINACPPRACDAEVMTLLYSAKEKRLWGKAVFRVGEKTRQVWLGNPPDEIRALIDGFIGTTTQVPVTK
jgi:hypothetical protein